MYYTTSEIGGTSTVIGYIPHLRHPKLNILMPVKVLSPAPGMFIPVTKNGCLVFVLPGGGEYVSNKKPEIK